MTAASLGEALERRAWRLAYLLTGNGAAAARVLGRVGAASAPVARNDPARVGRLMRAAPAVFLTVTECTNPQHCGSVINFRIVDERVRFDVSLDAAEKNNVKLSSRLLTVANRVQKGAP